ncbi:MAG: hypothetical protein M1828_001821 [Chrysothrix sp. TS-e1954]|nr:MAG: hypothetical protein M1828_001821 [Chrysothrix sp. TS-e1954]
MSARAQMSKSTARSRAFFKQRKQAKNLIEALDDSLGKLHLYVWAVLGKTELSEIEKDRLMRKENLGGDAWAQIHVEAEINRVLGPASTSFMSILRCLVDQLLQLSTHNAIPRFDDVDGTATLRSWIGAARHEEKTFLDGLRFAWDAPSHGKTLGVIQDCNTRLDELLRAWEMAERKQLDSEKRSRKAVLVRHAHVTKQKYSCEDEMIFPP